MDYRDRNDCFFVITDLKAETTCFGIVTGYSHLKRSTNWIWEATVIDVEFSLESVLLGYINCMPVKMS